MNTREAAKWAGITYRQLDYWIAQGAITPAVEYRQGKAREFSWRDLTILKLMVMLRDDGYRIDALRDTRELIDKTWITDNPEDAGVLMGYGRNYERSNILFGPQSGGSMVLRGDYFFWFNYITLHLADGQEIKEPKSLGKVVYSLRRIAQEVYQELNQPSLLPEP